MGKVEVEEFCPNCEDWRETEVVAKVESYTLLGLKNIVLMKAKICCTCGEQISSDKEDEKILTAVYTEYDRRKT